MENKTTCPICGAKMNLLTYKEENADFEVYLANCPNCGKKGEDWHLTKEEALNEFSGIKDESFAIVPTEIKCLNHEIFVKINGNPELIPYKKESIKKFIENHFFSTTDDAFHYLEREFEKIGANDKAKGFLINAFLAFKSMKEQKGDEYE